MVAPAEITPGTASTSSMVWRKYSATWGDSSGYLLLGSVSPAVSTRSVLKPGSIRVNSA
jgi:hypothetical protein